MWIKRRWWADNLTTLAELSKRMLEMQSVFLRQSQHLKTMTEIIVTKNAGLDERLQSIDRTLIQYAESTARMNQAASGMFASANDMRLEIAALQMATKQISKLHDDLIEMMRTGARAPEPKRMNKKGA